MRNEKVKICHSFVFILFAILCFTRNSIAENPERTSKSEGFVHGKKDVELYYQIRGAGQDTLLMLHDGPGLNIDYLAPDLALLEESFTLIYYDQRGSGRSNLISKPDLLTVNDHVEDLEVIRKYFGIERLTLFGHSWGAMLASFYALQYPAKLSRMVFSSPGPPRNTPYMQQFIPKIMDWMDTPTKAEVQQLMQARQDTTINAITSGEAFWEVFIRGYFADPLDLKTISSMKGSFCTGSEAALRNGAVVSKLTLESAGDFDLREKLHEIDIPVLIISGREDIFPVESMREWKAAYPDSRLVLLDRAGHYPQIEQPEEFFKGVKEFLKE